MDFHTMQRPAVEVNVPPPPIHTRKMDTKSLSVDRALQFTPLTTCLLPPHGRCSSTCLNNSLTSPDRIPIPEICRARQSVRISNSMERKKVQQILSQYPIRKVTERLSGLLDRDVLAEIKFKQPPSTNRSAKPATGSNFDQSLSPMAKKVLEMTKIDYRYPSTKNADHSSIRKQRAKKHETPPTPRASSAHSNERFAQNGLTWPSRKSNSTSAPQKHLPSADSRREEYVALPGSPKRLKLSQEEDQTLRVRTQREAADASLLQFQDFLLDLFEVQDQMEPSQEGQTTVNNNSFFEHQDDEDDNEPRLNITTLDKLQHQLKKLISLKRLDDTETGQLRRLQQMCENSIERTQTVNLKLPPDPSTEDEEMWQRRLIKAENGVASASVLIYTILGCPKNETLLSMEVVAWIPNVLVNIFENCLIPIVEARPDGFNADLFKISLQFREDVRRLLDGCRKLLELIATACIEVTGCVSYVNTIEFLAAKLIFVQNAITEKQSTLGLQPFEKARKTAMAVLARIYSRFPQDRSAILDEILSSLDKLPSTSRSARQFRLGDGKNIQLISALFMQLVQTTSMEVPKTVSHEPKANQQQNGNDEDSDSADDDVNIGEGAEESGPSGQLQRKVDLLFNSAAKSAQDIVSYLVGRASKTTKSGDSPYRSILDLFIEDLIIVLPSYEWPSSELLLRALASRMTDLAKNDKAASAKNMALESLGTMGSAISELKASIPTLAAAVTSDDFSQQQSQLVQLANIQVESGGIPPEDLIALNGPLAVVANHLQSQTSKQNLQRDSARSYFLAHYAKLVTLAIQKDKSSQVVPEAEMIALHVLEMFTELTEDGFPAAKAETVTEDMARLGFALTIVNLGFCRRLYDIVKTVASSLSSDQALVRSRSLKSVLTVLESDSSLLDQDHTIAEDIFRCASDDSALVRDSALSLIARFIISKPALQQKGIKRLLECAEDSKMGVQKRAIGHLKDIYLKDQRPQLKAAIARKFLQRLSDREDTIVALAKQTLEDIWIKPTVAVLNEHGDGAKSQVAVQDLTAHLMTCITPQPEELTPLLKTFITSILKKDAKSYRDFCTKVVDVLFEKTISEDKNQAFLLVLTVLAEADSKLIPPTRLSKLQNYLSDIRTENDLFMFRSAIEIFCCVLPDLSDTHRTLLKDIQDALMKSINKLGRRTELDAVMICLRTIDGILHNTERLTRLAASIFMQLSKQDLPMPSVLKLLRIAGAIGKEIDFEGQTHSFAVLVPTFKNGTVATHFVATIYPLTKADQPLEVRLIGLASLGSVCQANPSQFNRPSIREVFFSILKAEQQSTSGNPVSELQSVVLKVFNELYGARAAAKEISDKTNSEREQQGLKQLGGDRKTRDEDSAVSAITPDVVSYVLHIALAEQSENALLAAKTLASISHQGLIHPKQCLGAFVALSTSQNSNIARVGVSAHHLLHEQHESHCEREYMSAIHQAFEYQSSVCNDPTGVVQPGNHAKLSQCFETVCTSNTKYVKKFLSGIISRTVTEASGDDQLHVSSKQVLFTRFIVQNVGLVEYQKLDELLHAVLQLELGYSKGGSEVAQAIENALQAHPDIAVHAAPIFEGQEIVEQKITTMVIDPALVVELKRVAPAAANLLLLIEARSYMIRQYGIGRDVRSAMNANKQAKDTSKAPAKIHGISGDRFWDKTNSIISALEDDEAVVALCKDFLAAISVDEELDILGDEMPSVEAYEAQDGVKRGNPGGRKRKRSLSATTTPTKKQRARPSKGSRRSTSISSKDDPEGDYED